ncbi:MAG TPA: serine/threonine-protein kinase [Ktedonobacterales bacterium]
MQDQEELLLPVGSLIRDPTGESYIVESVLGKGGFSAVYLVKAQGNQQQVYALKEELHPKSYPQARFPLEADLLKRLHHPALPHVYRVFEDEQHRRVYMLMEYIAGPTLEALRKNQPEGRFPLPIALLLMTPIVNAVMYLHRQEPPIVHRDIKPANIIVPVGKEGAFLVDFGIAKEYVENGTTNIVREVTPGYAALEQYSGGTTPRTDVYGLGATFYTLLTGKIPVDAIQRTLGSGGEDPLLPAGLVVPEIAREVEETIERAMAIDSEDRFETIEQFWQELRLRASPQQAYPVLSHSSDTSPTAPKRRLEKRRGVSRRREPVSPAWRRPLVILLFTLILFAAAGGTALLLSTHTNRNTPAVVGKATSSSTSAAPDFAANCVGSPGSVSPVGAPSYPSLAPCYAGTIADLTTNQSTAMYLMITQQGQGEIQGIFQGLGLVGRFTGTLTSDGQVHFTLPVHSGEQTLAFVGTIKIGGDIVGSFQVLDQSGNFTGEYGEWNISTYPKSGS